MEYQAYKSIAVNCLYEIPANNQVQKEDEKMCRRLFPLIALVLILCLLNNAQAQLNIDFTQTGDPVQAGFEGYFATHEQAATFTPQSYGAFGTTVTVAPNWAPGAPQTAMQMIDRGGDDGTDTPDLLRDWIGTDNRGLGNPMTLTISGLPAGAYSWLSYHHDPTNQTGLFDVTVNDALGSTTTLDIDISATSSDNITALADVTKFTATIASNGTNPVTLVFSAQASTPTTQAFFVMNAFELSVTTIPSPIPLSPMNAAANVDARVVLRWLPGDNTAAVNGHKLFLSGNLVDVSDGLATAEIGILSDPAFDTATLLTALQYDTTYYWRVDEASVPGGPYSPGPVWSFTVEPVGVPLVGERITATASSANSANEGPENTSDGSGLDPNDLHSAELADMWLSDAAAAGPAWIQYEFDKPTKLHQMIVWNHNTPLEPAIGFGIKEATIEYSVDGAAWTTLGTTHEFARAPGVAGYAADTTIDFGDAAAKYVRITPNSNWGTIVAQYGLSEVRLETIPVQAREPRPASGTVGLDVDNVTLSWRAGREATEHNVYLSIDEQAVEDGTAPAVNVSTTSYDTGELDLGQTYFWKIVEVNPAEDPSAWEGDLWNFATQEFLVVDDFESYNDIEAGQEGSNLVYLTWTDGFENPSVNGSTIGYTEAFQPTMETQIVHSGGQSVPIMYNNTVAALSEVTVNPANLAIGPDWSGHSAKGLTLWFYGNPCNTAAQMYVKVNGSQVLYDSDAENLLRRPWQLWYVDLTNFTGADLTNVTELAIGFEGGQGTMLLDDITLSGRDRQLVTPVEPAPANLVAHYAFEGNTDDSTGAHSATVVGGPEFVAGQVGQAIKLDGARDYLLAEGAFDLPTYSATLWFRVDGGAGNRDLLAIYDSVSGAFGILLEMTGAGELRFLHRFPLGNSGGTNIYSGTYDDGGWYHAAIVKSADKMTLYVNGVPVGTASDVTQFDQALTTLAIGVLRHDNLQRYFPGAIDEVYLYNRVLSEGEIAWLAGRTKPFDKP